MFYILYELVHILSFVWNVWANIGCRRCRHLRGCFSICALYCVFSSSELRSVFVLPGRSAALFQPTYNKCFESFALAKFHTYNTCTFVLSPCTISTGVKLASHVATFRFFSFTLTLILTRFFQLLCAGASMSMYVFTSHLSNNSGKDFVAVSTIRSTLSYHNKCIVTNSLSSWHNVRNRGVWTIYS